MIITPPAQSDYPEYYQTYVGKVDHTDLLPNLTIEMETLNKLLSDLSSEQQDFRYAPGKWSLKELLIHMADSERIFSYRALRFARRDETPLAGFDQEDYGNVIVGTNRDFHHVLSEFQLIRASTVKLFESFTEEDLNAKGSASGGIFTVRANGYIILGHAIHHRMGIERDYMRIS